MARQNNTPAKDVGSRELANRQASKKHGRWKSRNEKERHVQRLANVFMAARVQNKSKALGKRHTYSQAR